MAVVVKIIPAFEKILQRNSISAVGEAFDKVVIITDRDEVGTEEEFIEKLIRLFKNISL